MSKPTRRNRRRGPGPDYQFTLGDFRRMVEQLGGHLQFEIVPKDVGEPCPHGNDPALCMDDACAVKGR